LIETGHDGGRASHDWNSTTDHLLCSRFLHDTRSFYYTPRRSCIRNAFCVAEGNIHHDDELGDRGNMISTETYAYYRAFLLIMKTA